MTTDQVRTNKPIRKHYLGTLTDSSRWDMVRLRPDDVIVVTPPKCGTTWMQAIIALLLAGRPDIAPEISINMPWVDIRARDIEEVAARLDAMPHRRSMKSHTPFDGLPLDPQALYIAVFRHPLDAHFSFRNHARNVPMDVFDPWYPQDDSPLTFQKFLDGAADGPDGDALSLAHILHHYQCARALAERPNVALFHFADLRRDLAGCFAQLARMLDVAHSDEVMADLVAAARFDNMRQNAERFAPAGGKGFFKSDAEFFHNGGNGQWQGQLSDAELAAYDAKMDAALSPEARQWLEHGGPGLGSSA